MPRVTGRIIHRDALLLLDGEEPFSVKPLYPPSPTLGRKQIAESIIVDATGKNCLSFSHDGIRAYFLTPADAEKVIKFIGDQVIG